MRRAHLEAIAPICPACRAGGVVLAQSVREQDDDILEGLLECQKTDCRHLYPIIDGIPILIGDLRKAVSEQILNVLSRDDLSETLMGLLGECAGPSSGFDSQRQHLSSYCWSHWGDFDREKGRAQEAAGIACILDAGLQSLAAAGQEVTGPLLDLGCSVGRASYELARRSHGTGDLVVGIDLNFAMLRVARQATCSGRVRYARRVSGLIYEERSFEVPVEAGDRVDYWCADALALPFRPGTFGFVNSLNLLDCLQSPVDHLASIRDLLRPGGAAVVATPFDWSPAATAPEAWIGGHSPYGEDRGRSEQVVRGLLNGTYPVAISGLRLLDEVDGLPWMVRLHERSTMQYRTDLFVMTREAAGSHPPT